MYDTTNQAATGDKQISDQPTQAGSSDVTQSGIIEAGEADLVDSAETGDDVVEDEAAVH